MSPIIITAPHAQTSIDDPEIRDRIMLSDHDIWKCSDPYTDELQEFTCASEKIPAKTHRLVCDLNRPPNPEEAFHKQDFYGSGVFHPQKNFTVKEKKQLINEHWHPFHNKIINTIQKVDESNPKNILLIDYHNTSGDHPINGGHLYMPCFVISNLGKDIDGKRDQEHPVTSIPPPHLMTLQKEIVDRLPVSCEINGVYNGGFDLQWYSQLQKELDLKSKLYAIQLEYNLDFIVNPISGKIDRKALKGMQEALNEAIEIMYESF